MSIGTRIETYLIPAAVWEAVPAPGVPSPAALARDALDIERRAAKGTNLPAEGRRYGRLCSRLQDVARMLAAAGRIGPPEVWLGPGGAGDPPRAAALLSVLDRVAGVAEQVWGKNVPLYPARAFVPPMGVAGPTADVFDRLRKRPGRPGGTNANALLECCAQAASDLAFLTAAVSVTTDECRRAAERREEQLQRCGTDHGLIDVIDACPAH